MRSNTTANCTVAIGNAMRSSRREPLLDPNTTAQMSNILISNKAPEVSLISNLWCNTASYVELTNILVCSATPIIYVCLKHSFGLD